MKAEVWEFRYIYEYITLPALSSIVGLLFLMEDISTYHICMLLDSLISILYSSSFLEEMFELMELLKGIRHAL